MTNSYFQNRAREILADPLLLPLVCMVTGLDNIEATFFIQHEPGTIREQMVNYLKEA